MNENQESQVPAAADDAGEAPAAPARRRAPRKTAAAVVEASTDAPVEPSAEKPAAKPRTRKPRTVEPVTDSASDAAFEPAAGAPVEASSDAVPAAVPARRTRAPRKTAAAAPVADPADGVSAPVVQEPVAEEASAGELVEVAVAPAEEPSVQSRAQVRESVASMGESQVESDDDEEDDDTLAGVAFVIEEVPEVVAPDAGELFAEVMSGAYDTEAEPESEEESAESTKRVLRPEPDAPKLQKVLAQAGIGSRRDMEQLIAEGKVLVNGEPANTGMRIVHGDQIKIAGKVIKVRIAPPSARVLAYHKPVGEVVTHHDPDGRPTVFRRLPRLQQGRWLSVGRLDINTEGLLLFTNSGDLANQLMHPRFGVEREYAVRVLGTLEPEAQKRLLDGVEIEGQKAAFRSIENGGGEGLNHWYRVVITEGRNREVRKLFDAVGLTVSRLIRIRYGTVVLPRGLKRGVWVELDENDVRLIRQLASPGQADRSARGDRGDRGDRGPRNDRNRRGGKGGRDRAERGDLDGAPSQEAPAEGGQRPPRPAQGQRPNPTQGAEQGQGQGRRDRGDRDRNNRGNGGNGPSAERRDGPPRDPRPPREGRPPRDAQTPREPRPPRDMDDDIPLRIPNPLEQTFDRRFATGSKRITAGFGRPTEEGDRPQGGQRGQKGGPRQPDPMQTSVGYIGADAYFTRPGGGKGGKGGRRR